MTESESAIEEEVVDDINKEFLSFETKKITNQFNLNIKQSLEMEESTFLMQICSYFKWSMTQLKNLLEKNSSN